MNHFHIQSRKFYTWQKKIAWVCSALEDGWQKRNGKRVEKNDQDYIYGLYFTEDGQNIDQGKVEVVDVNDNYV